MFPQQQSENDFILFKQLWLFPAQSSTDVKAAPGGMNGSLVPGLVLVSDRWLRNALTGLGRFRNGQLTHVAVTV